MATSLLRRPLRKKNSHSQTRRMLAIEQFEARWVMDHSLASAAFAMGGGSAFFEGSTVTIQNGNDLFVVDVSQGVPAVRSTTSLRYAPAAVVLDDNELTLVISSQMGLSEILVYDLSDPSQPIVKQTQSVDGIVTRAWIADEKIVLQTIDPNEIPEAVPVTTLDDLSTVASLGSVSEEFFSKINSNQEAIPEIQDLGDLESEVSKPSWSLPDPILRIYDRARLNLGALVQNDQFGTFDDLVILPDGIVTISTARVPHDDVPNEKILEEDNFNGDQPVKWFTSTTLSRWSYDELGASLEFTGSYVIEDEYAWSEMRTTIDDGVTSLFLLSTAASGNWETRLHRFRLGSDQPFDHSDLKLTEYLDQNWIIDFAIDQKTGVLATSTKLISIDLMGESSPIVLATRTFTDASSTWKQLGGELWLRISNPFDVEGSLDGSIVSLELFEVTSNAIESVGSETKIEGDGLNWSCFGPESFTYLEDSGIFVTSMQRFQNLEKLADEQKSSLPVHFINTGNESEIDLQPSVIEFPNNWFYELHLLDVDRENGVSEIGNIRFDSMVVDIGESEGHISVLTDRELVVLSINDNQISQTALALVPTFCPVDVLGIAPERFVEMLHRMGLGFIESMMDNQGIFVDLGLEKINVEGIDDVIAITVGNESWQVRMGEGDFPELVTSQSEDNELATYTPDVNGDGQVDSIDAKLLMERLNERGFYPAPIMSIGDEQRMAMDINGDGWLSALDPLVVINRINGFHQKTAEATSDEDLLLTTRWLAPARQSFRYEDEREKERVEPEGLPANIQSNSEKSRDPAVTDYLLSNTHDWGTDEIDAPIEVMEKAADEADHPSDLLVDRGEFESLLEKSLI